MRLGRHLPSRKERPAERPCLKCKEAFESEGIGNRLCEKCRCYSGIDVLTSTGG